MDRQLGLGVIGAGLMGTTHIRILNAGVSGAQVVAVSDARIESAERIAAEVGVPAIHADAYELIRDPAVEAVIIASPAETHEAFALACLQEGKPVLCEKPLAATAAASRRVLEAEAALDRRLVQIGFMRRYDPGYVDLKRRLDAGAIGAPLLAHCAHRNPVAPPTFTSEMLITDSIVHEIDTVRWLLGEEIARATVFAPRASSLAAGGLQDPQLVIFEMASGRLVDVECFVNAQYGYDIRCEVVGETGTLELAAPATVTARQAGGQSLDVADGFQRRFNTAYVQELQTWVAGGGEPSGPSAWDGYAAAAVCEAAVESLHTGRPADVRLAARPDLYAQDRALAAH
jgi:myo-inositol 2-dehydrogenase/D-chiro-inositol 1-dehydrogenase